MGFIQQIFDAHNAKLTYLMGNRGWEYGMGAEQTFPWELFYMVVAGRDSPVRNRKSLRDVKLWDGLVPSGRVWRRDGWVGSYYMNSPYYDSPYPTYSYYPVGDSQEFKDDEFSVKTLRAPFPLTLDEGLVAYASVSIGSVRDWRPYNTLLNGSASREVVDLMNKYRHKPSILIFRGYLYLWVNTWLWHKIEPEPGVLEISPSLELELFQAYRELFTQLHGEVRDPAPLPVRWPDQCWPGFPSPSDPRAAAYLCDPRVAAYPCGSTRE
jgi:hypothetical protein